MILSFPFLQSFCGLITCLHHKVSTKTLVMFCCSSSLVLQVCSLVHWLLNWATRCHACSTAPAGKANGPSAPRIGTRHSLSAASFPTSPLPCTRVFPRAGTGDQALQYIPTTARQSTLSGNRISGLFSFPCCTHQLMSVSCMPVTSWEGCSHRLKWAWQSAEVSVGPLPLCCVVFLGWQYNEGLQLSSYPFTKTFFKGSMSGKQYFCT